MNANIEPDAWFPLSAVQRGRWFLYHLDPDSQGLQNLAFSARLSGAIEGSVVARALRQLAIVHPILRARFRHLGADPEQSISAAIDVPVQRVDVSDLTPEALRVRVSQDSCLPFDLADPPLIRAHLYDRDGGESILLLTVDHMVCDAWSFWQLLEEFGEHLSLAGVNSASDSQVLSGEATYLDYVRWQQDWLGSQECDSQWKYWEENLGYDLAPLQLTLERRAEPQADRTANRVPLVLSRELCEQARRFARQNACSLFVLLLAAYKIVLHRITGQSDIPVGSHMPARRDASWDVVIGDFANPIVLRTAIQGDSTVAEVLKAVRGVALRGMENHDFPFVHLVERLNPSRVPGQHPLFQTEFVFQHARKGADLLKLWSGSARKVQWGGLELSEFPVYGNGGNGAVPLVLEAFAVDDEVLCKFNFDATVFDADSIVRLADQFQTVLSHMIQDAQQRVDRLPLLGAEERHQLLVEWNETQVPYPQERCLHELFESQVERTPEATALLYGDERLSYRELNERANRLAHYLRARGVGAERLVGICIERSVEMVVGLLGILKAGGAYVPLDPTYPAARLEEMLRDAQPAVIVTQSAWRHLFAAETAVVAIDGQWSEIGAAPSGNLPVGQVGVGPGSLMYVLYTSGSTGTPKGAMNEHGALVNRLCWMQEEYRLSARDVVLQKTPLSFDVSGWEVFWPLLNGACMVLAKPGLHRDPRYLSELIAAEGVSVVHFVPSMLQSFLDIADRELCKTLRIVVCSGEELSVALQERCLRELQSAELHNLYGPTEAAIDVTYWACRAGTARRRVPIGRPIWNTQMYLLDRHLEPVPIGVAGEIYIGGAGVARGYLNRAQLTAERFIEDPFRAGGRLYRTGDLGRYLADGNIEFLGRNDHQVKIRGFRIELGEIETQLCAHAAVKEAVVLARTSGGAEKRLVAYVTSAGERLSVEELRSHLQGRLPEYMVPAAYVQLESLPLTANGKLDRGALPEPDEGSVVKREYAAPQGAVEQELSRLWEELLGVQRVGREDNFFELGGHSLLAMQLVSRLQTRRHKLTLTTFFELPSIKQLATFLESNQQAPAEPFTTLVKLRPEGSSRPLFLVHDVSGDVFYGGVLSHLISKEIPVYGLRAPPITSPSSYASIEALAAEHVATIRQIQPQGPYRLAGWSIGGLLAFEMSNRLLGIDEQVEFLGLIDSHVPGLSRETTAGATDLELFIAYLRTLDLDCNDDQWRRLRELEHLPLALAACQQLGFVAAELRVDAVKNTLDTARLLSEMAHRYVPSPLPLTLNLYSAEHSMTTDISRGWRRFVQGELEITTVAATHTSIVKEPHVRKIAASISDNLQRSTTRPVKSQAVNPLIVIQGGSPACTPVCCVPGAGATIAQFVPLAQALGERTPVYGLQPRGLDGISVPHTTVAAAASAYIRALRETLPKGPFRLVGHSFGGWVVLEMARQLVMDDDLVAPIFLLDTEPPCLPDDIMPAYGRADILMRWISLVEQTSSQHLGLTQPFLESLEAEEALGHVLRSMIDKKILPRGSTLNAIRGSIRVFAANVITKYAPRTELSTAVSIFRPTAQRDVRRAHGDNADEFSDAWRRHAPNSIVLPISGNHMTMLGRPHIDQVVAALRSHEETNDSMMERMNNGQFGGTRNFDATNSGAALGNGS